MVKRSKRRSRIKTKGDKVRHRRARLRKEVLRAEGDTGYNPDNSEGIEELYPGFITTPKPDIGKPIFNKHSSRMFEGRDLLPGVDHRITFLKFMRATLRGIVKDLEGEDFGLSTIKLELIYNFSAMSAIIRDQLEKRVRDEQAKLDGTYDPDNPEHDSIEYLAYVRNLTNLAKQIGMKKILKTVEEISSLEEYLGDD